MNFEKMFKMIGFSLIVGLVVLMTVSSAIAMVDPIERKPIEFVEKPGVITPNDPDVDTDAPFTDFRHAQGWQNEDITVKVIARDADSGVDKTFYAVYDPTTQSPRYTELVGNEFTVSEEGKFKIVLYSVDNAGNVEETKSSMTLIDKVAPETKFKLPEKTKTEAFTVEFNGKDDLSGIRTYRVSLDSGKTYTEANSMTFDKEGTFNVQVAAEDEAGNVDLTPVEFKVTVDFPSTGGSPSGSSGGSYVPPQDVVYELTEAELEAGFNVVLNGEDVIKFDVEGEEFTLSIAELVFGQKVTFDINDMSFDFTQRQSNILDITGDDVEDIKIVVGTIDADSVLLTLSKYDKPLVVEDEEEEESDDEEGEVVAPVVQQQDEETFLGKLSTPVKIGVGSLILILFVSMIGFIIFKN